MMSELRSLINTCGLDAVIVPSQDMFLGEYVPQNLNLLQSLTSFTGSNGIAVVDKHGLHFFTDSRYTLQAAKELDNQWQIHDMHTTDIFTMLKDRKVGIDFKLHSIAFVQRLQFVASEVQEVNLTKCYQHKTANVYDYSVKYAGKSREEKFAEMLSFLRINAADGYFICDPHDVCYMLNLRGDSLKYTPIFHSHMLVKIKDDGLEIVVFSKSNISKVLDGWNGVVITYVDNFDDIALHVGGLNKICINHSSNYSIYNILKANVSQIEILKQNWVEKKRSVKNEVEVEHFKRGHKLDGLAVQKFLSWIEEWQKGSGGDNKIDEMGAAGKLLDFRLQSIEFKGESFECISAFAENAAIVHYRVSEVTNKAFDKDSLYLVDSGGQYFGCTTDVTRIVPIGKPTAEQKRMFTLVLKGHIALARAIFKMGTTGSQLDILARGELWRNGLDYGHGTGHGVGAFLSVHEGPCGIGKGYNVSLEEGMVISNEPGFYKEGEYGIRIESLLLVVKSKFDGFLCFETLTKIPIDTRLVDYTILNNDEKLWLENYNQDSKMI